MEFAEVVRRRRMVRRYAPDPIPDQQLRRIIETARRAPSAGFTQGQSFVVVTDAGLRRAMADLAGEQAYVAKGFDPWLSAAPALIVVCTSEQAYRDRYAEADKLGPDTPLAWPVPYWYVDGGCSLMLLLLAAVDQGLAAGLLTLKSYEGIRRLLSIPEQVQPIGIVSVGKPAADRPSGSLARGWKPSRDVIHWNRWAQP
jgi:nitroreductase